MESCSNIGAWPPAPPAQLLWRARLRWGARLLVAAALFNVSAQDFRLGSFSAKTGSGTPTSEEYMVPGGINLGLLVSAGDDDFVISGGFTGAGPAVETEEGVRLAIQRSPSGIELSWPLELAGYLLETTPSLSPPEWASVELGDPAPDGANGDRQVFLLPITGETRFYRLRTP